MSREADEAYMRLAIDASRGALLAGNLPFGAALVNDGTVLKVSANQQLTASHGRGDCTAHAEIVLVHEATAMHGATALVGGTVYASGEPCAMCCGALFWARVERIVYAASTPDIIAALGGAALPIRCAEVLRSASSSVTVDGPLLREDAVQVLREFAGRARH